MDWYGQAVGSLWGDVPAVVADQSVIEAMVWEAHLPDLPIELI